MEKSVTIQCKLVVTPEGDKFMDKPMKKQKFLNKRARREELNREAAARRANIKARAAQQREARRELHQVIDDKGPSELALLKNASLKPKQKKLKEAALEAAAIAVSEQAPA
jgi:hypothetical protein